MFVLSVLYRMSINVSDKCVAQTVRICLCCFLQVVPICFR